MSSHSPRTVAVALALSAALGLAACGGDQNGRSTEGNGELFSTDGFEEAVDAVGEEAGDDAEVLQIQITQAGADFKLQGAEGVSGLIYTGGELEEVQVDVVGPGGGQGFPLDDVDPEAIDRIVDGVREQTGDEDTVLNAIALSRNELDGELGWTINARGSDPATSALVFHAAPDGSVSPAL